MTHLYAQESITGGSLDQRVNGDTPQLVSHRAILFATEIDMDILNRYKQTALDIAATAQGAFGNWAALDGDQVPSDPLGWRCAH